MKTKAIVIALTMVISAASFAVGKDDPRNLGLAVVAVKGSEVFKVIYRGETASRVKLNVYNEKLELVFTETMHGVDGFIRPLNFAGLQYGEYTIELIDAVGKKSEIVSYRPAQATSAIHVAKLHGDKGQYLLSAEKVEGTMSVKIFDEQNNLLHDGATEVSTSYAKVYTLKDVVGSVTFEITDDNGTTKVVRF